MHFLYVSFFFFFKHCNKIVTFKELKMVGKYQFSAAPVLKTYLLKSPHQ